jgi:adenosylhomocysteine nucleosidase
MNTMNEPGQVHTPQAAVIISARAEWNTALEFFKQPAVDASPFGDYFTTTIANHNCLFFHGGWGKVAAAASAQYVIARWQPRLIVNLGTCGGFEGAVNVGEVILADETVIYDIYERMGDPQAARAHFTTRIDLSYLRQPYPHPVRIGRLVSADQDIDPAMVETLKYEYGAAAADWESGAIAWTAARNNTRALILRAVSDLVGVGGGELYDQGDFQHRARGVMLPLLRALPAWLDCAL